MKKNIFSLVLVCGLIGSLFGESSKVPDPLSSGLADIRFNVTRIESESTNKVSELVALAKQADHWVVDYPERPEPKIWKAIVLAARAKYVGISALVLVDEARTLLDEAIAMDPKANEAAGLNALGMLYHKVPIWPISFGNNKKARAYFVQALAASSNLDTNFRMGEFLLDMGEKEKGLSHLKTALALPARPDRPEDVWKRKSIEALIQKYRDVK